MLRVFLCGLAGVAVATAVSAQSVPDEAAPGPVTTAATASPAPEPMSLDDLDQQHGRQGLTYVKVQSLQALTANNSGNSITANRVDSGDISISDGAFAGFSGIGNFVVNSGHNNNLQGSLSINVVTP